MTELTKRELAMENLVHLQFCEYNEKEECIYTNFSVSKLWLLEHLDLKISELSNFLDSYTSEDSQQIYSSAVLEETVC